MYDSQAHLSGNSILRCQILRRHPHGNTSMSIGETIPKGIPEGHALSKRNAPSCMLPVDLQGRHAHVFCASTDTELRFPQADRIGALDDCFEPRATETIDGESGRVNGNAGLEAHMSREVGGILTGWNDVAEEDGVDQDRIDGSLGQGRLGRDDTKFRCRNALEGTTETAKWRSFGGNDEDVGKLARGHDLLRK